MATVWAFREGTYLQKPSTGWSHTIEFAVNADGTKTFPEMQGFRDAGINSLIDRLEEAHLRNEVERLAIVAHGKPGLVFMSGGIGTRPAIPQQFRDLSTYLRKDGMLSFVSCNAGEGTYGDIFLINLSTQLPGRVIVGYDVYGFWEYFPSDPGMVQESIFMHRPKPGAQLLTPWGDHAKWASRGKIVRVPVAEQKSSLRKHCANPRCPGHSSEYHRCEYKKWGSDETLMRYNP